MPATINPSTGDPCERVFAAFARNDCKTCGNTGTVTIEDDDGHDCGYRRETVPCPECKADEEAAWWAAMDEAVQWHHDEAEMLAIGPDNPPMVEIDGELVPY